MAFSFSSTAGTSGVTSITVSATSRQELTDIVQNFTLSNQTKSVGLQVAQRAYVPLEKYIIFQPTGITWNSSGDTGSLTIQSNDNWAIEADSWIQLSRYEYEHRGPVERPNTLSGNGNTIIGLRCSANTGNTRTGGISGHCLSNTALTAYTSVSQAGSYVEPTLSVSPLKTDVNASGGTGFTLAVTSNQEWNAYTDARWVTINTISGSGNGNISFDVVENATDIVRESNIYVVSTASSLSATSVIVQSAQTQEEPYIIVSPTTKRIGTSGGSFIVTVSSNTEWETAVVYGGLERAWIALDKLNGEGDDTVEVRIDPDLQESPSGRSAYISFYNAKENLKAEVNIVQIDTKLTAKFITTSPNQTVRLYGIETNYFKNNLISMEVDGVITTQNYPGYTFDTVGEHTVIYNLIDDTTLNNQAFMNTEIVEIMIPDRMLNIGIQALNMCFFLKECTFPYGVTNIPDSVLGACESLTSVTLPNTVVTIGEGYLGLCTAISSVTIPQSVTAISYNFLDNCTALNELYAYPQTAPTITYGLYVPSQSGTLHYPRGADYSSWVSRLPSGWTAVADL